ncbi:MAG: hypothetical protein ACFCUG_01330 [Thiotrichales bacterium]
MARSTQVVTRLIGGLLGWFGRYIGWLLLSATVTLGGGAVLMLFKRWSVDAVITSMLAWPALGFAMALAIPIALLPLGRFYFYSAIGSGLFYNTLLMFA